MLSVRILIVSKEVMYNTKNNLGLEQITFYVDIKALWSLDQENNI